ncbi:MAG: S41 family peptidase, partial [Pseudomonadota bacterium]|nr:S41 family peptidase [Pseudomonadota bacterium]
MTRSFRIASLSVFFSAFAGALVTLTAPTSAEAPPSPSRLAGWRADLALFADQLPKRHANAFHFTSRARFEREITDLDKALPMLSADAFWVGLARIEASIGDGHTFMRMPADAPMFGIAFERFGSDYRVVAIAPDVTDTAPLGARLVAIGGVPLGRIEPKIMALSPADETDALRQARAQELLDSGVVLHGLGLIPDDHAARYTFADDRGRTFSRDLQAEPLPPRPTWKSVVHNPPLSQRSASESLWCTTAAPATVYCNFRSYKDLGEQASKVLTALDAAKARRLVIDLRDNGGGNFCEGLDDLVLPIARRPAINRDGGLFVLVGPQTFSAAMSNAAHFRQLTHAVLVGAPIGEKPDSYQEIDGLTLPHTGWT